MNQPKLWTRSFIILMGVNFSSALSFNFIKEIAAPRKRVSEE